MHNPISGQCVDFAKSAEAAFRMELHDRLRHMRKVALRLGHLTEQSSWTASSRVPEGLLKGRMQFSDLTAEDLYPNVRQKGVDMRIGIDMSSLALKRRVRQIVLMAGDADFIPAAKLAWREGGALFSIQCGPRLPRA